MHVATSRRQGEAICFTGQTRDADKALDGQSLSCQGHGNFHAHEAGESRSLARASGVVFGGMAQEPLTVNPKGHAQTDGLAFRYGPILSCFTAGPWEWRGGGAAPGTSRRPWPACPPTVVADSSHRGALLACTKPPGPACEQAGLVCNPGGWTLLARNGGYSDKRRRRQAGPDRPNAGCAPRPLGRGNTRSAPKGFRDAETKPVHQPAVFAVARPCLIRGGARPGGDGGGC